MGHGNSNLNRMAEVFRDPRQEWRRLVTEFIGTFLLVTVAAGAGMVGHAFPGEVSRTAAVVAPGLMVMAVIMAMGRVSGAHLNPAVSIAFALRADFPWARVPGYVAVQLAGATLAAWLLQLIVGVSARFGGTYPPSDTSAVFAEILFTFGLVTVILGTSSGAQNIGIIGSVGVGGYIALAGLWGSPLSGASMNPARSFGPAVVSLDFSGYWVYVVGPLVGAALAAAAAWLLRGPGGGRVSAQTAQGEDAIVDHLERL